MVQQRKGGKNTIVNMVNPSVGVWNVMGGAFMPMGIEKIVARNVMGRAFVGMGRAFVTNNKTPNLQSNNYCV